MDAQAQLSYCIGDFLNLGPNVITFRTLQHLGPNVITSRTLLNLGKLLHQGLQQMDQTLQCNSNLIDRKYERSCYKSLESFLRQKYGKKKELKETLNTGYRLIERGENFCYPLIQ